MTKEKKISRLGTYSNDGLGTPIGEISSENLLKEGQKIVQKDLNNIKKEFKEHLYRLEYFIKEEMGVIPRTDGFVNWFFDKKKITQTGKNLPEIKDEEIITYAKEYLLHLKKLAKPESISQEIGLKSFEWKSSNESLKNLYLNLISNEYIANIDFEQFKIIFSGTHTSEIKLKIIWLKKSKNKSPNKKSISDLILLLCSNCHINTVHEKLPNILSACFAFPYGDLEFTHSNLSNVKSNSEHYSDLNRIVKSL